MQNEEFLLNEEFFLMENEELTMKNCRSGHVSEWQFCFPFWVIL